MVVSTLREAGKRVAITAPTGIAALQIAGQTIYSFAGIGLGKEGVTKLIGKIRTNPNTMKRWKETQVLIIDEISMVPKGARCVLRDHPNRSATSFLRNWISSREKYGAGSENHSVSQHEQGVLH